MILLNVRIHGSTCHLLGAKATQMRSKGDLPLILMGSFGGLDLMNVSAKISEKSPPSSSVHLFHARS